MAGKSSVFASPTGISLFDEEFPALHIGANTGAQSGEIRAFSAFPRNVIVRLRGPVLDMHLGIAAV